MTETTPILTELVSEDPVDWAAAFETPFETLLELWDASDPEIPPAEHRLISCAPNVWAWWGLDGEGVPPHTDKRVGDVHMVCLKGSRHFVGSNFPDSFDQQLHPGDRVTFSSYAQHAVTEGEGECILLCFGEEQSA